MPLLIPHCGAAKQASFRHNRSMRHPFPLPLLVCALALACFSPPMSGEVKLPGVLSSHMVLQRERPIHLWGWADPGERVSVTMEALSRDAVADSLGKWSVYLPPRPAGGPFRVTVAGTNRIVLEDVLMGDVWFASGQSNMEMPLKGFPQAPLKNSAAEIAGAGQPRIRLLTVPRKSSDFPLRDAAASWTVCSPETAAPFSAVAYLFGREISARENVPVGLIDSTWGGTVAESWVSLEALSSDAALMPVFATRARAMESQADVPAILVRDKREDEAARQAGRPQPQHTWHPDPESWKPSGLFNAMVAPFTGYGIKGVIWYQGESNSRLAYAPMYARLFPALITDWRAHWGQGDFPFLYVQIANFTSSEGENWAIIREAQRRTLAVAQTAMVVTADIGEPGNVHPADKQTVGARLALAARALVYGEKVEFSGPAIRQSAVEGAAVRLWFDHAEGLAAKGGAPEGFEIAGEEGRFVSATARIEGSTVLVSDPRVPEPKHVRYGWSNAPVVNLYNGAGLPASPFTTEMAIPKP